MLKSLVPVTSSPTEPSWVADPGFSASDCRAYLIMRGDGGSIAAVEFGDVVSITLSSHRDKFPVARMGEINPIGFVGGHRTVAGGIVVLFHSESDLRNAVRAASEVLISGSEAQVWLRQWDVSPYVKPDELPPVDLLLVFISETGTASAILLRSIAFLDEGMSIQVDQPEPIISMSFLAVDYEIRHPDEVARSKKARQDAAARPERMFPQELPVIEHSIISFNTDPRASSPEVVYGPPADIRSPAGAYSKQDTKPPQPGMGATVPASNPTTTSAPPSSGGIKKEMRPSSSWLDKLRKVGVAAGQAFPVSATAAWGMNWSYNIAAPVLSRAGSKVVDVVKDAIQMYQDYALPELPDGPPIDVQMIRKAAGLVTRYSVDTATKAIRYTWESPRIIADWMADHPAESLISAGQTAMREVPSYLYKVLTRPVVRLATPVAETVRDVLNVRVRLPGWGFLRGLGTGEVAPYRRDAPDSSSIYYRSYYENVYVSPFGSSMRLP